MEEKEKAKDEDMLEMYNLQAKDLAERSTHEEEMARLWNAMGTITNARASAISEEIAHTKKVLAKEDKVLAKEDPEAEKEPQDHLHLSTWNPMRCS